MDQTRPVVILSTADYDAAVWTNKQHIASRLSADRDVYYIESIGLRRPRLNVSDLKRVFQKLARSRSTSGPISRPRPALLTVVTPRVLPWHANRVVQKINQFLIRRLRQKRLPTDYVLWTFSPVTYGLESGAIRTIYHSVDLLHMLPGVPAETLLKQEANLVSVADRTIASSLGVKSHLSTITSKDVLLWENVADVALFASAKSASRANRAIFVGNITPSKIDFDLLEGIAAAGVDLVLVGPLNIDGTNADSNLSRLLAMPTVSHLGVMNQADMAQEIGSSKIGLIPYRLNEYTEGVFPMKVFEYIAGGLQVVATELPSLESNQTNGLHVVKRASYVDSVLHLMKSDYKAPTANVTANSWDARLSSIRKLIDAE